MRRVVLLVTSPRLPAGLLTADAWDLVRTHPVLVAQESEQTVVLRAAGASVEVVEQPSAEAILGKADPVAVWLAGPAGDEYLARDLGLRLAREPGLAELELMYGSWDPPGARLLDAVAVTDRLRVEDPWKREQTHQTLARYLLEEAYEAYDSIIEGDLAALRGEMGDVLLQVLLHSRLAEEQSDEDERWSIDDVAGDFVDKMIRRNPHVFGGVTVESTQEIVDNWERIKREEQGHQPGRQTWSLPSLVLAAKLLPKVSIPDDDDSLGARILRVVAESEKSDAEAEVRQALRRYMDAS